MSMNELSHLKDIQAHVATLVQRIKNHTVAKKIIDHRSLSLFLKRYGFSVWDFFCLLKALYRELAYTDILYQLPLDPEGAHLINEILGEEEGDKDLNGKPISHFDWYLQAMKACDVDITGIESFIHRLKISALPTTTTPDMAYHRVCTALAQEKLPTSVQTFVTHTFNVITQSLPAIAAAFTFGREGITPGLFSPLVQQLEKLNEKKHNMLIHYFKRHIILDGEEHFNKAFEMLARLCKNDNAMWATAKDAAYQALLAWVIFLDEIKRDIIQR